VTSTASAMPGDFNSDGHVDADDYSGVNGWQDRFGVDLDGDDMLMWQRNLGAQPAATAALDSVPEPATLLLIMVASAGLRRIGAKNLFAAQTTLG